MLLELPKKFKHPIAEIADDTLMIFRLERFEDLNYELTYAIKKKKCIYCDEFYDDDDFCDEDDFDDEGLIHDNEDF